MVYQAKKDLTLASGQTIPAGETVTYTLDETYTLTSCASPEQLLDDIELVQGSRPI
jgi:hypothetical protein